MGGRWSWGDGENPRPGVVSRFAGESRPLSPCWEGPMKRSRSSHRTAILTVIGLGASLWTGCSDSSPDALVGPSNPRPFDRLVPDLRAALAAQKRHTSALLHTPGVVGTAVGRLSTGEPV